MSCVRSKGEWSSRKFVKWSYYKKRIESEYLSDSRILIWKQAQLKKTGALHFHFTLTLAGYFDSRNARAHSAKQGKGVGETKSCAWTTSRRNQHTKRWRLRRPWISHKMREIVNLAKLLRHFLGLWTVQHLKPRHTVTSQHSPLLGRSVRDPAASLFQAPRWSDPRNWGSAETKKREETFFPPRPPFRVFDTLTRLPHYLRAWN